MTNKNVRTIWLDLFLTLLTCGLWNVRVQYVQMEALNLWLDEKGARLQLHHRYSFLKWGVLCLITLSLWHIYYEWKKSQDVATLSMRERGLDGVLAVVLSILGFSIVVDAIHQTFINQHFSTKEVSA
jgi:hypothetical protein